MNPRQSLSSYLIKPNLSGRHKRRWAGFKTNLVQVKRTNPHLASRTIMAVIIWAAMIASIKFISNPHQLPGQAGFAASSSKLLAATVTHSTNPATASLTSAVAAKTLPGGPTGQLMPPGTMAPDYTYRNSYSWGQCTWYVAGRRQVPAGWGNAAGWYSHAVAAGWSVGTTPAIAAIAWTPMGYFGHVALVEKISADGSQVYISEMNAVGIGVKSYRWVPSSSFKYIY